MGRRAYSYRDDPAVPSFPDDRPLVLFDGDCALCSHSARTLLKHGPRFRLARTQSVLGRALLIHYGLSPDDPSTMLVIENGRAIERSDGVLHLAASLPFPYRAAVMARLIPRPIRDFAYGLVARYRRRFPGRAWCAMPPSGADLKDRILG